MGERLEIAPAGKVEVAVEAGGVVLLLLDEGDGQRSAAVLGEIAGAGCAAGTAADDDHTRPDLAAERQGEADRGRGDAEPAGAAGELPARQSHRSAVSVVAGHDGSEK